MLYKVTKQYARGSDAPVAEFNELNDAKLFIEAKLQADARLKVKITYRLFEGIELLQEFTESSQPASSGGAGQGQGAQQSSSFQPTPFKTAPRPGGMPQSWIKDSGKKEEDKK